MTPIRDDVRITFIVALVAAIYVTILGYIMRYQP